MHKSINIVIDTVLLRKLVEIGFQLEGKTQVKGLSQSATPSDIYNMITIQVQYN